MRHAVLSLGLLLAGCSDHTAAPGTQGEHPRDPSATADARTQVAQDARVGSEDAFPSAHDTSLRDAARPQPASADAAQTTDGQSPEEAFIAGVNVHDFPKPTAYGFTAADGADRMGDALAMLGVTYVRGVPVGDVPFLARLRDSGVSHVVLLLDPKACGTPFSASTLQTLLNASVTEATRLGLSVLVEGLNEWDLFKTKPYNAGVTPAGMSARDFVGLTQKALYEAAHPLGLRVLGPSVGHPQDDAAYGDFPDVSPYVDVVNMHFYYGTDPANLPIAERVTKHQAFQGAGKPVWVTETGISAYGGVTDAQQANVISTGLSAFAQSGLIQAAFNYELLDNQKPGWSGTTYVPDNAEYHFGLFTYEGSAKPAADVIRQFLKSP